MKELFQITANCITLTPMLCGGADITHFELRSPTLKGLLRFWWRAFHPQNGEELFLKESTLFGCTQGASSFRLVVNSNPPGRLLLNHGEEWPREWGEGLKYLLFSAYKRRKKWDDKARKKIAKFFLTQPIVKPGLKFTVIIYTSRENILDLVTCLWLLENLGGIGARSRRGAGSFKVEEIKIRKYRENSVIPLQTLDKDISLFNWENKDSGTYLDDSIKWITSRWGRRDTTPEYTAFKPGEGKIIILQKEGINNEISLLNYLGREMQNIRNTYPYREAEALHTALSTYNPSKASSLPGKDISFTKPAIGLPIIYRFKENFGKIKAKDFKNAGYNLSLYYEAKGGYRDNNGILQEGVNRRASPLFISCHKAKNGTSHLTLCHLPAPLLPPGQNVFYQAKKEEIKEAEGKKRKEVTVIPELSFLRKSPDQTFVDDFLEKIRDKFNAVTDI